MRQRRKRRNLQRKERRPCSSAEERAPDRNYRCCGRYQEDSPQAVRELQNMGIHVVMLTGDNERTAKAIGAQAGVDEVIAGWSFLTGKRR